MGVGKTTVCELLKSKLPNAVFLDGDWCWDMDPFKVTEETKELVLDNIAYVLNSFIKCSAFENVLFCWVMHEQETINTILSRLHLEDCSVTTASLVCSEEALKDRLGHDIESGIRTTDIIDRSMKYLPLYNHLEATTIDTSSLSAEEVCLRIIEL